MSPLRLVGTALILLATLPVALLLLVSLPLGLFALMSFVFGETIPLLFAPGVAVYILGICVPVGVYHWRKAAAGRRTPCAAATLSAGAV